MYILVTFILKCKILWQRSFTKKCFDKSGSSSYTVKKNISKPFQLPMTRSDFKVISTSVSHKMLWPMYTLNKRYMLFVSEVLFYSHADLINELTLILLNWHNVFNWESILVVKFVTIQYYSLLKSKNCPCLFPWCFWQLVLISKCYLLCMLT